MTTIDFITELLCQVDDNVDEGKHPQSNLYPSEIVTLALWTACLLEMVDTRL